ncbi:hypothetical protein ABL78_1208 [Leptomonas seymouri]|uniref:J domain-containing protein n=1 Tax=Leptomonas seymouri TaxID=5684 RepID=A0A0N1I9A2_LEPSE|nr:hypothetical protein ABL78_1208 [Leptomonas seymouri]|eukprot:KPI89715.1 hypothetical protein ABL78_1208 [Leptomonas seymouri]
MSQGDAARFILGCASDRDVLGLSQFGPLSRKAIQKAFHARALHIHPDKARGTAPLAESPASAAAFAELVGARDRLIELLPLSRALWQLQQPSPQPVSEDARADDTTVFNGSMAPSLFTVRNVSASMRCDSPVEFTKPPPPTGQQTESPLFAFSASKCHTLGCLRMLSASDVQTHQSFCVNCRMKPRKCMMLGCLRMVAAAAEYCREHQP